MPFPLPPSVRTASLPPFRKEPSGVHSKEYKPTEAREEESRSQEHDHQKESFDPTLYTFRTGIAGKYRIRVVNGTMIRNSSIDHQEFGLYAIHQDFPDLVPEGEIWVAGRLPIAEQRFFISGAAAELKALEEGANTDQAYEVSCAVMRAERREASGRWHKAGNKRTTPVLDESGWAHIDSLDMATVHVYDVDADLVRDEHKVDFLEGGNSAVYPWIPRGQEGSITIWLEGDLETVEAPLVALHEYVESLLMDLHGLTYDHAHSLACKVEWKYRRRWLDEGTPFLQGDVGALLPSILDEVPGIEEIRAKHPIRTDPERNKKKALSDGSLANPVCPLCGGRTKSNGYEEWCREEFCEYRKRLPAINFKALMKEWHEEDHPRGQPENAGQFAEKPTPPKAPAVKKEPSEQRRKEAINRIEEWKRNGQSEEQIIYEGYKWKQWAKKNRSDWDVAVWEQIQKLAEKNGFAYIDPLTDEDVMNDPRIPVDCLQSGSTQRMDEEGTAYRNTNNKKRLERFLNSGEGKRYTRLSQRELWGRAVLNAGRETRVYSGLSVIGPFEPFPGLQALAAAKSFEEALNTEVTVYRGIAEFYRTGGESSITSYTTAKAIAKAFAEGYMGGYNKPGTGQLIEKKIKFGEIKAFINNDGEYEVILKGQKAGQEKSYGDETEEDPWLDFLHSLQSHPTGSKAFDEEQHPRGQPENAGQFAEKPVAPKIGDAVSSGNEDKTDDGWDEKNQRWKNYESYLKHVGYRLQDRLDLPVASGVKKAKRSGKWGECETQSFLEYKKTGADVYTGDVIHKGSLAETKEWFEKTGVAGNPYAVGAHVWNVKDGQIVDHALGSAESEDYIYYGRRVPKEILDEIQDPLKIPSIGSDKLLPNQKALSYLNNATGGALVAPPQVGVKDTQMVGVDQMPEEWVRGQRGHKGYNPIAALRKIGEELAHRKEPPFPMPGYGQIFLKEGGSGEVLYVGGDGDDDGFSKLVKERLSSVQGIDEVTYEAEAFPPKGEGWIQVYPKQRDWKALNGCRCPEGQPCDCPVEMDQSLTQGVDHHKAFKESEHPRGQPENAGEFAEKPAAPKVSRKTKANQSVDVIDHGMTYEVVINPTIDVLKRWATQASKNRIYQELRGMVVGNDVYVWEEDLGSTHDLMAEKLELDLPRRTVPFEDRFHIKLKEGKVRLIPYHDDQAERLNRFVKLPLGKSLTKDFSEVERPNAPPFDGVQKYESLLVRRAKGYDPNQPREPTGTSEGGQFAEVPSAPKVESEPSSKPDEKNAKYLGVKPFDVEQFRDQYNEGDYKQYKDIYEEGQMAVDLMADTIAKRWGIKPEELVWFEDTVNTSEYKGDLTVESAWAEDAEANAQSLIDWMEDNGEPLDPEDLKEYDRADPKFVKKIMWNFEFENLKDDDYDLTWGPNDWIPDNEWGRLKRIELESNRGEDYPVTALVSGEVVDGAHRLTIAKYNRRPSYPAMVGVPEYLLQEQDESDSDEKALSGYQTKGWHEVDHPRGQPENAGQFAEKPTAPRVGTDRPGSSGTPTEEMPDDQPLTDNGVENAETGNENLKESLYEDDRGTRENPISCGKNIKLAAKLLSEGKHIRLSQPRQVATLLDKMNMMIKEALIRGDAAPKFDLCKVSVRGTNLFCQSHLGIPRVQMPQMRGQAVPGSFADKLPKSKKTGKVDLTAHFIGYVQKQGIKVDQTAIRASNLRASQAEIDGARIAQLINETNAGKRDLREKPIFVSKDDYVIDGHHHWAAVVGWGYARDKDPKVPVYRLNMDIGQALSLANDFTKKAGLKPKSVPSAEQKGLNGYYTKAWHEEDHPRGQPENAGEFAEKPMAPKVETTPQKKPREFPKNVPHHLIGLPVLRKRAGVLPFISFMIHYNVEMLNEGLDSSVTPPPNVVHDRIKSEDLDPSELGEWDEYRNDPRVLDIMKGLRRGEEFPPVLVDGLKDDPKMRSMVLDGHHRAAAYIFSGKREVPVVYSAQTLTGMWKNENRYNNVDKAKPTRELEKEYRRYLLSRPKTEQKGLNNYPVKSWHEEEHPRGQPKNSGQFAEVPRAPKANQPNLPGIESEIPKARKPQQALNDLRAEFARAAQEEYDVWSPDDSEEGDPEVGSGGICDRIADAMGSIIVSKFDDVDLHEGGQEGDDHAYLIARIGDKYFGVDIPPSVYETGGGYNWRKIPDVTIHPEDVEIWEAEYEPEDNQ